VSGKDPGAGRTRGEEEPDGSALDDIFQGSLLQIDMKNAGLLMSRYIHKLASEAEKSSSGTRPVVNRGQPRGQERLWLVGQAKNGTTHSHSTAIALRLEEAKVVQFRLECRAQPSRDTVDDAYEHEERLLPCLWSIVVEEGLGRDPTSC
jgi:hypothetical protein